MFLKTTESHSEKLLGLIVNNELSWKDHLYGENWREEGNAQGLLPQLAQRVGLLSQIVHRVSKASFNSISNGLFTSKLIYCIQVIGNVWGYATMDETTHHFSAFTIEDCRKLQVLQNKVLRMKTNLPYETHTSELLKESNELSVHQLVAYHTLLTVHKSVFKNTPKYISQKFNLKPENNRQLNTVSISGTLTVTKGGFMYRGGCLWNQLPNEIRINGNYKSFKSKIRNWIRNYIQIRPESPRMGS